MSSTNHRRLLSTINFENIAVKDLLPPKNSRQNISFLQLPRELRDPIYRHSIVDGSFAILRLNKLINMEASQSLSEHAVYRINLGFLDRTNWSDFGSTFVTPVIQHVDLRIKAGSVCHPSDMTVLSGLWDKNVIRESCVIAIDCGKDPSAPCCSAFHSAIYRNLARLSNFKRLVVKIVTEQYEAVEFEGVFTADKFRKVFHYDTNLLNYHIKAYERVQSFLERHLGPAEFHDSVEGHCLAFRPLELGPDPPSAELEEDEDSDEDEDWDGFEDSDEDKDEEDGENEGREDEDH